MSRRRELSRRLASLTDIAGIMSAMKGLALMETRILQEFLGAQRRMVSSIELSAAQFLFWHAELMPSPPSPSRLCVLVGSEQGFCGDFNETLLKQWERVAAQRDITSRWVIIGRRLANRIDSAEPILQLPGASVADEVPNVLLRLTRELERLILDDASQGSGVSVLYHCDATGEIRLRHLLPFCDLPQLISPSPFPPELNVSPAEFLYGLTGHYLYAALNEVLYSSLMAENRQRHAHMDSALNKLDEDRNRLRLAYNAQRQEDITEEIEVILLSSDLLEKDLSLARV